MRHLRVHVKVNGGRQFVARAVEISEQRAILRGDVVLPTGTLCELQIAAPPNKMGTATIMADMKATVGSVVFASGDIRLELKIKSLNDGARSLIDSYSPDKQKNQQRL